MSRLIIKKWLTLLHGQKNQAGYETERPLVVNGLFETELPQEADMRLLRTAYYAYQRYRQV